MMTTMQHENYRSCLKNKGSLRVSMLRRRTGILVVVGWLAAVAAIGAPLGTTFTYQGFLQENGLAANGTYDFEFNLFDSEDPLSGLLLGSLAQFDLQVRDGRFVADLDFGDAFADEAAWLEIRVRASATGPLISLYPLQRLTPVPTAFFSSRSAVAANAQTLGGLGSEQFVTSESDPTVSPAIKDGIDWQELTGIPAGFADGVDDLGSAGPPVGTIAAFAGEVLPSGWLLCDGAEVSREIYADLFAVLGGTWGIGDGITTFGIPDLRGRFALGSGMAPELTERMIGASGGSEEHTLTVAEMPRHSHTIGFTKGDQNGGIGVRFLGGGGGPSTSAAGGDQPHNNMPPFATVHYIIKY